MYNLALIGNPVEHSKSPAIHTEFLRQSNLKGAYICIQSTKEDLLNKITSLQTLGFRGCNITVPHKENILELDIITKASQAVSLIKATNTLIFNKNNTITADNTDYLGFWESINKPEQKNIKKACIIGAGGSARAVTMALLSFAPVQEIIFYIQNRASSIDKAKRLIQDFQEFAQEKNCKLTIITEFNNIIGDINLLVNTSPIGMAHHSEDQSPVTSQELGYINNTNCLVYDLVYTPEETELLKLAKNKNLTTQNGKNMLFLQAKHSFIMWTGAKF